MSTLSNIGITSGSKVEAWHVTQSIDAFTGTKQYDILLSGSLTVTGSLIFNQISNNILGTSSLSTTSSYAVLSSTSNHSLVTEVADNETYILTFSHPSLDIASSTSYYIGNGNITTTGSFSPSYLGTISVGMPCPIGGTIVSASISSNCLTTASLSSFVSKITLGVNLYETNFQFNDILYQPNFYNIKQAVGVNVNAGDRLAFEIVTGTGGTLPTKVSHNIQLYIKSNG
jgi:hypothetical protein